MQKRVFIVHGWEGKPTSDWLPWLKNELEKKNIKTVVPEMPDTEHPKIDAWVKHLAGCVQKLDEETYLVGHSIGGQTVLRYLEQVGAKEKAGGVLLVASWVELRKSTYETKEDEEIAKPWIETPIAYDKVMKHARKFTAIFSDNDPYVPLSSADVFKEKLGAKIVIEHGKGHFNDEFGIKKLDSIRDELLLIIDLNTH